jgi:hypothetical protein
MKPISSMRTRILILCLVAGGLAAIADRSSRAQSNLQVPGPNNQYQQQYAPPAPAQPPPYAPDNGDTVQLLPQLSRPAPQPAPAPIPPPVNVAPMTAQAVPSLPAVFRGCWQG